MSKVLCEKSDLVAIADSIRSKTGSTDEMKVAEIPQKIEAIETGSNINIQASKSITYTSNGTATIAPDAGYDALSSVDVTVNVSGGEDVIIKQKTFKPSLNYLLIDNRCVVTHNCGKIPKAVFIFSDNTNNSYVGYGYIFNFSGSNDTGNVSLYNSLGVSKERYRVAFTTTTMKFTMDSSERYNGGKHYYFTFVC